MSRTGRSISESGIYHVMLRGNGHQILFEERQDYTRMVALLEKAAKKHEVEILAWCLMPNHAHLVLLDARRNLSACMHSLATGYSRYSNARTGHEGHVFQNRFKSETIESDQRLLDTVRYVHRNPERAGIATTDGYEWSSYREYLGTEEICSTELVLSMLGGVEEFIKYTFAQRAMDGLRPFKQTRIPDEEAVKVAVDTLSGTHPGLLASLPKAERDQGLRRLRDQGLGRKQIARLTGIGQSTIYRACKEGTGPMNSLGPS